MTEPVRPLEALIEKWRVKADKAWHVGHDDVEDGVWSYQHEANGRASAMRQCADELAALLQAAAPPAPTAEDPFELLRQRQRDLPPDAAKVLLDNLWELYEGTPYPAAPSERVSEGKEP